MRAAACVQLMLARADGRAGGAEWPLHDQDARREPPQYRQFDFDRSSDSVAGRLTSTTTPSRYLLSSRMPPPPFARFLLLSGTGTHRKRGIEIASFGRQSSRVVPGKDGFVHRSATTAMLSRSCECRWSRGSRARRRLMQQRRKRNRNRIEIHFRSPSSACHARGLFLLMALAVLRGLLEGLPAVLLAPRDHGRVAWPVGAKW